MCIKQFKRIFGIFVTKSCGSFVMEYTRLKAKSVQGEAFTSSVSLIHLIALLTPRVLINCPASQIRGCCLSFQSGKLALASQGTPIGVVIMCFPRFLVLSSVLNGCQMDSQSLWEQLGSENTPELRKERTPPESTGAAGTQSASCTVRVSILLEKVMGNATQTARTGDLCILPECWY